jgi:hypothetical protein
MRAIVDDVRNWKCLMIQAIPVLLILCLLAGVLAPPAPAMESGKASPPLPTPPTPEDSHPAAGEALSTPDP